MTAHVPDRPEQDPQDAPSVDAPPAPAPVGRVNCSQAGCPDEAHVKPMLELQRTQRRGSSVSYWRKPIEATIEEPLCIPHARGCTLDDILTPARWAEIVALFPVGKTPMKHLTRLRLAPINAPSKVSL